MEKILSISIAAYNAENDISRCLESLICSGVLEQLDIIVVNDGSQDNTADIVKTYEEKYRNSIRLINKEYGGHGSTINTSIQYAIGKYYKILDSDDWVDSENLSKLVKYLENIDVDLVLNPYREVDYNDHTKTKLYNPVNYKGDEGKKLSLDRLTADIILYMHSLTFRTNVIKQMGSIIDENCFYVDMEYCVFPLQYIDSFAYLDYPIYQYLLGSQTQSMNQINLIKRRNQHLKVTKRLGEFYSSHSHNVNMQIKALMAFRIKYAIYQQYKIYLSMPAREAIGEIKEFDSWLDKNAGELYVGPKGHVMQYIKLNRKLNFRGYVLLTNIMNRFGFIK